MENKFQKSLFSPLNISFSLPSFDGEWNMDMAPNPFVFIDYDFRFFGFRDRIENPMTKTKANVLRLKKYAMCKDMYHNIADCCWSLRQVWEIVNKFPQYLSIIGNNFFFVNGSLRGRDTVYAMRVYWRNDGWCTRIYLLERAYVWSNRLEHRVFVPEAL